MAKEPKKDEEKKGATKPSKEEKPEQEQEASKETVISLEQIEKAKKVSKSVFNDALALLFDADNRLKPLCKTKDLSFTLIIGAIYVLLSTLLWQKAGPPIITYLAYVTKLTGTSIFLGTLALYFGVAASLFVVLRYAGGKDITYFEGLNIMGMAFIPMLIALIIAWFFGLGGAGKIVWYIEKFGALVGLLLVYSAIRDVYEVKVRSAIYLLPASAVIFMLIFGLFFKLIG
jgi:hypothetical protein